MISWYWVLVAAFLGLVSGMVLLAMLAAPRLRELEAIEALWRRREQELYGQPEVMGGDIGGVPV